MNDNFIYTRLLTWSSVSQSNIENSLKILKNCFTYLPCGSTDQKTIYGNLS